MAHKHIKGHYVPEKIHEHSSSWTRQQTVFRKILVTLTATDSKECVAELTRPFQK